MPPGFFTEQMDLPLLLVILFFVFFLGLVYHLRQEDKREGYPLDPDPNDISRPRVPIVGFPPMPRPKVFIDREGNPIEAPRFRPEREINAVPAYRFPGAPLMPLGDPLLDGLGPASWAPKKDEPDRTHDGEPKILPMRDEQKYRIEETDINLFGLPVFAGDGPQVGTIKGVWINAHEYFVRYLEVEAPEAENGQGRVVAPIAFADIKEARVRFGTVSRAQFLRTPGLSHPDQITVREEDRVNGYYAGGILYYENSVEGPLL